MPMKVNTLRPGLLVSLKTAIVGNVNYKRVDIEADHLTEEGIKKAIWETERTIEDPEEHEKAVLVRSKCRSLIVGVCTPSTFGLLCPNSRKDELDTAIAESQLLARAFNETATQTQVNVYVIMGQIAQDDVQAVQAINGEVRDLITAMETGLKKLDVGMVREAASKAKLLGRMLSDNAAEKIQAAVETAREVAKRIVKAGEEAAGEVDRASLRLLRESRTAFLDLDEEQREISAPANAARAIDLEPEGEHKKVERRRIPLELVE